MIIKRLIQKIKNFNKTEPKIKLGRWNYENSNLKVDYANHDHCGDKICQYPIYSNDKNNIKKY